MKKILSVAFALMLILGMGTSSYASTGNGMSDFYGEIEAESTESAEPNSSRWYTENVKEKDDVSFTLYSDDKKRMVNGTYDMVATYHVYRDGSGRRVHVKDTYYYTWTGYYRTTTTGTGSTWKTDTDYVNVQETFIDRGPIVTLFGYLL